MTFYDHGKDRMEIAKKLEDRLRIIEELCKENSAVTNSAMAQVLWYSLSNRIVKDATPPVKMNYED